MSGFSSLQHHDRVEYTSEVKEIIDGDDRREHGAGFRVRWRTARGACSNQLS